MAAIKISTLTAKAVPVAADSFVIVDSAAADNKKVSYSDLRSTILDAETTINESGADVDFRVESDTKTHALFVQGSDGFVGINKLAPTSQLHIDGDVRLDGTTVSQISFADSGSINYSYSNDSIAIASEDTVLLLDQTELVFNDDGFDRDFRIVTAGSSFFVQGSDGFVGINKLAPTRQLDVVGNTSLDGAVIINEGAIDVDFEVRGDSQLNALFVQGNNGNVGIFTGTPATELEVNGNIGFTSDGQGINFGNSSGGSSTSTLLDDYEEGTWTPIFSGGFTSPTYASQIGTYTKIGNTVTVHWFISGGDATTGAHIRISGLPYVAFGTLEAAAAISFITNFDVAFTESVTGQIGPGGDIIYLYKESSGGFTQNLTSTDTNGSCGIFGSATYTTS